MPEMEQWWCDECKAPFSDMTVKPLAICPHCLSRCFTLAKSSGSYKGLANSKLPEKPVESKPETVVT